MSTPQMDKVVASIVEAIEAGAKGGEWVMPWTFKGGSVLPHNATTGAQYHGANVVILWFTALQQGWPSSRWATFKQWQSVGAQVRKGSKGTDAFIWKSLPSDNDDPDAPRRGFYRGFYLFNAAQVDNDPYSEPELDLDVDLHDLELVPAQRAVGRPSYNVTMDVVNMPPRSTFATEDDYLATLAHELGHWTGHSTRLNREYGKRFGDQQYAAEELVAELSAAFTCAELGISTVPRLDHAQYLEHWISMLKADASILFTVASKAQAATDYLMKYTQPHAQEAIA